jgi:hypothetical protein
MPTTTLIQEMTVVKFGVVIGFLGYSVNSKHFSIEAELPENGGRAACRGFTCGANLAMSSDR